MHFVQVGDEGVLHPLHEVIVAAEVREDVVDVVPGDDPAVGDSVDAVAAVEKIAGVEPRLIGLAEVGDAFPQGFSPVQDHVPEDEVDLAGIRFHSYLFMERERHLAECDSLLVISQGRSVDGGQGHEGEGGHIREPVVQGLDGVLQNRDGEEVGVRCVCGQPDARGKLGGTDFFLVRHHGHAGDVFDADSAQHQVKADKLQDHRELAGSSGQVHAEHSQRVDAQGNCLAELADVRVQHDHHVADPGPVDLIPGVVHDLGKEVLRLLEVPAQVFALHALHEQGIGQVVLLSPRLFRQHLHAGLEVVGGRGIGR